MSSLQHGAAFDPHAILQHHPGADGHVGPNCAVLPDHRRWVLYNKVLRLKPLSGDVLFISKCKVFGFKKNRKE